MVIECLDWADFIPRYDSAQTLFYFDPPYWGNEHDYGKGMFTRDDFAKMAELLKAIEGKFLLSINDRPAIRALYQWAHIRELQVAYTMSKAPPTKAGELLISNFKPD